MKELSKNEELAYKKLTRMAQVKNPVELSLRKFDLKIAAKDWSYRWKFKKASHAGIRGILERLQEKGYITMDYSDKTKPKIVVNGGGLK